MRGIFIEEELLCFLIYNSVIALLPYLSILTRKTPISLVTHSP